MGDRLVRFGWFASIWAASVMCLGAVGFVIRAVLNP
jgi:preprotein translocase subunit Sss1